MKLSGITFSRALFGFILACFLLPFMTISCGEQKLATLSGLEVMGGADLDTSTPEKEFPANGYARTAFMLALAGLIVAFTAQRYLLFALLSALGLLTTLAFRWDIARSITKAASSEDVLSVPVTVHYLSGYWLAFIGFILALVVNGLRYWQSRQVEPDRPANLLVQNDSENLNDLVGDKSETAI